MLMERDETILHGAVHVYEKHVSRIFFFYLGINKKNVDT
jgi:hypothetical protein